MLSGDIKQESGIYREGPSYQRRGSLQLWQFLVALLDDPSNSHFIAWTGRGMEFKLIEPEEVKDFSDSAKRTANVRLACSYLAVSCDLAKSLGIS